MERLREEARRQAEMEKAKSELCWAEGGLLICF